jgi:hypothetical protein
VTALWMTRSEREAFLAGLHVGIVAVEEPGRSPMVTPVWYSYLPGGTVRFVTGRATRKNMLIGEAGRISLIAQSEEVPYKYVAVEGPVSIVGPAELSERRALAHRYLGHEVGEAYLEATADADDVIVELTPELWRTTDFSKSTGE